MQFFEGEFPEPKIIDISKLPVEAQIRIIGQMIKSLISLKKHFIQEQNYEQCNVIKNTIEALQQKLIDLQINKTHK